MLFQDEKILIYHPGKCGGTTVEHLFLKSLRKTTLAQLLKRPCFASRNNTNLTDEALSQRINFMVGYIVKKYEINKIYNIYLQHADIHANIEIHGKDYINSLFKITFIRNPFPRILSAFYYNTRNKRSTFRNFILEELERAYKKT